MFHSWDHANSPPLIDASRQTWNQTITVNYPPCHQREYREANWVCLRCVQAWNPLEHRSGNSRLFVWATFWYSHQTKSMLKIPMKLIIKRKPVISTIKMETKQKKTQPSQKSRIITAERTSCQSSPRTTKRRHLSRIGCCLNSYLNEKPTGKSREPECFPNSTAAEPPTNWSIRAICPKSLRWLIPWGPAAERKSWISFSKQCRQTFLVISTES